MKKNGRYRFNLSFPAETEEQIQAGELLERLGNRKSVVVVEALKDFLAAHPALLEKECKVEIKAVQAVLPESIADMVREMIEKRLAEKRPEPLQSGTEQTRDVSEMLDNLDIFQ